MQEHARIDSLLDELISYSEILAGGSQPSFTGAWEALLNERSRVSLNLAEAAQQSPLTRAQTAKLKSVIDIGAKIRFPIAAKRENLRAQLAELRAAQRAQRALKPFRRTNGRRLNVREIRKSGSMSGDGKRDHDAPGVQSTRACPRLCPRGEVVRIMRWFCCASFRGFGRFFRIRLNELAADSPRS